jgi:hypothetical protein
MLPYILAAVGGYLIGDSMKKQYAEGGMMASDYGIMPVADGGYMGESEKIYRMAETMTDSEHQKKLGELNKEQKKQYEILVRLGDSPKLAIATVLLQKQNKWDDDTIRAYTMAKGGIAKGSSPKYFIEFLNKKKGFSRDKKEFASYEDAIKWGRKNLENFNSDMVRMEYADGGMMAKGMMDAIQFDRNRNGSLYDRGNSDSYYGRARDPHWYPNGTYYGEKVTELTKKEIEEYNKGYDENTDYKEYANGGGYMEGGGDVKNMEDNIKKYLAGFPDDAQSWDMATDEVRELANSAKEHLEEYDNIKIDSLNFRKLEKPTQWNTQGKKYIFMAWEKMSSDAKKKYYERWSEWFGNDLYGGMMAKGGGVKGGMAKGKKSNLKDVYSDLRSRIGGGLSINEESETEIEADVRNWGNWEHDYEDYDRDEDDFEDDDSMILSNSSYKKMNEIVKEVKDKYPDVEIQWGTSEKNYIDFTISHKKMMAKGGQVYKLGDKWSSNFDYTGMLETALKAQVSWGVNKLRKLYDSFEDVNYHTANRSLWKALNSLKDNDVKEAEKHLENFRSDVLEELK